MNALTIPQRVALRHAFIGLGDALVELRRAVEPLGELPGEVADLLADTGHLLDAARLAVEAGPIQPSFLDRPADVKKEHPADATQVH